MEELSQGFRSKEWSPSLTAEQYKSTSLSMGERYPGLGGDGGWNPEEQTMWDVFFTL